MTPDEDAVIGLKLALSTNTLGPCLDGDPNLTLGQHNGLLNLYHEPCNRRHTLASFTPDEADSLARVLQSWAGHRRRLDLEAM